VFRTYNFWIRLVAVIVLLLRIVGAEFGFSVDSGLIIDLATAIASVLVVLGVIQVPVEKTVVESAVDNKNQIGGDKMKSLKEIKADILSAKTKLEEKVAGEDNTFDEIFAILDGLMAEDEEDVVTIEEQSVSCEEPTDETIDCVNEEPKTIVIETAEIIEQGEIVEDGLNVTTSENEVDVDAGEIKSETYENETTNSSEFDEERLKTVVKSKLREVFEREIDSIITEVMA